MRKENPSKASRIRYPVSFAIDRIGFDSRRNNYAPAPVPRERTLWLRWERILEEETQLPSLHPAPADPCRAGLAASGPGVAGTVDIPVLQNFTFAVGVGRAGIAMAPLPAQSS
jgi:hypothetical protein